MTNKKQQSAQAEKDQEKLLTLKKAAALTSIPYRQLLSAVAMGSVPCYQVGNSRKMVFASEVLNSIRLITKRMEY